MDQHLHHANPRTNECVLCYVRAGFSVTDQAKRITRLSLRTCVHRNIYKSYIRSFTAALWLCRVTESRT